MPSKLAPRSERARQALGEEQLERMITASLKRATALATTMVKMVVQQVGEEATLEILANQAADLRDELESREAWRRRPDGFEPLHD